MAIDAKLRIEKSLAPNCHIFAWSYGRLGNAQISFLPPLHALAFFFAGQRF
jgi:hypothetical protein